LRTLYGRGQKRGKEGVAAGRVEKRNQGAGNSNKFQTVGRKREESVIVLKAGRTKDMKLVNIIFTLRGGGIKKGYR